MHVNIFLASVRENQLWKLKDTIKYNNENIKT